MNVVCLTGNITYIDNTKENATTIGLAVRRDYKNKDTGEYDTDFLNLVAFGYQKNYIGKYLEKGYKVEVVGSLRTSKYTDQTTGQERTNQSIVINSISSLQAVKKQHNTAGYNTVSFNQKADQQVINDFMNLDGINEDDLPF